MLHLRPSKRVTYLIGGTFALCAVFFALSALPQSVKERVTGHPLARQFLPLYRSLRKIPDVVFTPYLAMPNRLPRWSLTIAPEDILLLNSHLPTTSPFTTILLESDRVFVDGEWSAPGYEPADVQVRYKGLNANHWNSFQKSYRIKFEDDRLFEKASAFSLTIPYDKGYYAELLNAYRAQKLGLFVPPTMLVNLTINNRNHGVYAASEHWSKELLAKRRVPDDSILFGADDGSETIVASPDASYDTLFSLFSKDGINGWKSYTHEQASYDELDTLLEIVSYADDDTFKKAIPRILDLDAFYKWDIVNILAGNDQQDFENVVLLFNTATGLFQLIPVDVYYGTIAEGYREQSTLAKRILAIDEFRAARNKLLEAYLSDRRNLEDDLAFYDAVHRQARTAFFQDFSKLHTNFTYLAWVRDIRAAIVENFKRARMVSDLAYPAQSVTARPLRFQGSFQSFEETYDDIDAFLARNPAFIKENERTVALLPGEHRFYRTAIIPAGMQVVIYPGATVRLGKDSSILSYSPVIARGTAWSPIRMERLNPREMWGSFAVVNTGRQESVFEYVSVSGGSGARLYGLRITGMFALHDADASVADSMFRDSGDDDALNAKYGQVRISRSRFEDTASDAIDMDFVAKTSRIDTSAFSNIGKAGGGDAVDLSWSDMLIADNAVKGCSDKGVSVGENSRPRIERNTIADCDIGIAVKDSSEAGLLQNTVEKARIGVAAYRKKPVFDGGTATLKDNTVRDTKVPFAADGYSKLVGVDSVAAYAAE